MFQSKFCFNYHGLILACTAAFATSLLLSLDDNHLTFAEAIRAFLQTMIAGVSYAQNPYRRMPPRKGDSNNEN